MKLFIGWAAFFSGNVLGQAASSNDAPLGIDFTQPIPFAIYFGLGVAVLVMFNRETVVPGKAHERERSEKTELRSVLTGQVGPSLESLSASSRQIGESMGALAHNSERHHKRLEAIELSLGQIIDQIERWN